MGEIEWQLFDVLDGDGSTFAILKVPLAEYQEVLSRINDTDSMSTITSSGKIRLVRQRLNSIVRNDPIEPV